MSDNVPSAADVQITPAQIVDALVPVIEQAIAQRIEQVYESLEQMRGEFQQTINVMDGNDQAIVAELQKMKGMSTAEVLKEAGESWERFIVGEAKHLGLKVVRPKGGATRGGESDAG